MIINLQSKWDVWLITQFYNNKQANIWRVVGEFLRKNNLDRDSEEFKALKRTPLNTFCGKTVDVYWFVAAYFSDKRILKVLNAKDITDIFKIVNSAFFKNIKAITPDGDKELQKQRAATRKNNTEYFLTWTSYKSANEKYTKHGIKAKASRLRRK